MSTDDKLDDGDGDWLSDDDDELNYAQITAWLILSGARSRAIHVWAFLKLHVGSGGGGPKVAMPTMHQIADAIGLKREDNVKPYLDELIELGALRKKTYRSGPNRMNRRNHYRLRWRPPAKYGGYMRLKEWRDHYYARYPEKVPKHKGKHRR